MKPKAPSPHGHLPGAAPGPLAAGTEAPDVLVGDLTSALGEHALITITDGQGAIVYANDNFCALTRYSREELLGTDRRLLTGAYNPERLFQELWSTVSSGRTWKGEVKHRAKDGSFYWVDTTVVPVPDSSGTTVRLIGIHTDITAVKQLQQSLLENELRFQDLVQMSPDVILLTEEGAITFVNDAGLRLLRADRPEQLLGRLSLDFFHPDDHGRIGRRIEALLQGPGSVPALEETMIALDGTEVPVEVSAVSYLVDGKLIVQAICRDISERKAIEERWRQEHEYAEAVLNGLPGIVYHYDESGHFLRWNENLERVTGYGPEEIAVMRPRDFFPQEQRESVTRRLTEAFDVGAAQVEVEIATKDGRRIPYLFTAVRIERNGKPHIIGVGTDISERKTTEQALRDSLARFQAVTQATGDAMWEWDVITGAKWRNENYESLLRQPQALAGSADWSWDDRIHPEDRQRVLAHIRQVVDGREEIWTDEYRLRLDDGSYVEVFDRGIVLRDETGRSLRMVGAMQDITARKDIERRVRQERDYADAVIDSLPGVFYHFDEDMSLLRWNKNLERITGYDLQALDNFHPLDFFAEAERALVASRIAEVFEKGESQVEADYLLADGRRIPFLFTGIRVVHDGRQGFLGIGLDIEERKRIEDALRQETARFVAQVESSPDGVLVVDRDGRKVIQNQRLNELWKIPPEIAADPDNQRQFAWAVAQVKDPETSTSTFTAVATSRDEVVHGVVELKDGTVLERYSGPVLDKDGHYHGRIWTFRDITERRRAEHRIQYLATHDDLTGLPNRNLIQDRIEQAIVHARRTDRPLALLYLDLDRFKVINDGYGHPFGDAVLKVAAQRLADLVREGDTVSRQGGDEFLILLADLRSVDDAFRIAEKIIDHLYRPVQVQGRVVHLSGSIGVSVFPRDGETADALIRNADVAMYRAKDLGRNTYQLFTREMSEETLRRVELETGLRNAVSAGQLHLAYQPKVNVASGQITGCEALLRWHHPELGPVPPDRFIPIAEDSGLIVPIGDWALRTACTQGKAWLDAGLPPVTIAVNLSARQFLQQDVVRWVLRTLDETGLPPGHLELELTESLIAQNTEKVIVTIAELKAAGVKLSIDDFGTGYSSLSYLRRFRVDTLKIDRSFVRNMLTEPEDATIVLAVIALARNLNFKVIAEGVETEQHLRFLHNNGCEEMQGYYFGRPVPAVEFEGILREGGRWG